MIIAKAIELLEDDLRYHAEGQDHDTFDATLLALEALKRIEHVRVHPWSEIYAPLPGETMPEREIR